MVNEGNEVLIETKGIKQFNNGIIISHYMLKIKGFSVDE